MLYITSAGKGLFVVFFFSLCRLVKRGRHVWQAKRGNIHDVAFQSSLECCSSKYNSCLRIFQCCLKKWYNAFGFIKFDVHGIWSFHISVRSTEKATRFNEIALNVVKEAVQNVNKAQRMKSRSRFFIQVAQFGFSIFHHVADFCVNVLLLKIGKQSIEKYV